MGFFGHLVAGLGLGMSTTLMSTRLFLEDPGLWLVESSRARAHHFAAPNFAYGLVSRHIKAGLSEAVDLSSTRAASSGGEQITPSTVETFLELAGPLGFDPASFVSGYGLAEATCGVAVRGPGLGFALDSVSREALARGTASPAPADSEGASEFASVGTPFQGLGIEIRDPGGKVLGERVVGEIFVRGPTLMDGYLDDPEATEETLVDGWLRTGDLAYWARGELHIAGRAKDVIIVRGQNFYAEDIERIVERVQGVRKGCSAAVPIHDGGTEGIALVIETRLGSVEDKENCQKEISRELWRETGMIPKKVLLIEPGSLPKTTSGKLQRSLAGRMLQEV
jgi:fatty-acyl-CoA synthase